MLPRISRKYEENLDAESLSHTVSVATKHIDGSMNSQERNEILQWLADELENDRECRVVTNVRCLSEGVDVPSLDAVLFLSARNSQVDVVQSVGRVMRTRRSMATSLSLLSFRPTFRLRRHSTTARLSMWYGPS